MKHISKTANSWQIMQCQLVSMTELLDLSSFWNVDTFM